MNDLAEGLTYFVVFLFSTTLHEAAHAWAALRGGDRTAYEGGQVSLDPLPHIRREPIGMVVLPLITALATGWPLGFASAPYNPEWARKYPRRAAWMALAGPAANLLLVLIAAAALHLGRAGEVFYAPRSIDFGQIVATDAGPAWEAGARIIGAIFTMNLVLFVLNLLPLPPLDGSAAIMLFMSREMTGRYQQFLWSTPVLGFLGIFVAWKFFGVVFGPIFTFAVNLLYPGLNYG